MDIKIEELFPSSCEIKESGIVIIVNHDSRGSFQVNGNESTFSQSNVLILGYNEQIRIKYRSKAMNFTKISLPASFFNT